MGKGRELGKRGKGKQPGGVTPKHSARLARPQSDGDGGDLLLSVLFLIARGFIAMKYKSSNVLGRRGGNKSCLEQGWRDPRV